MTDLATNPRASMSEPGAARYWAFASMWAIAELVHLLNQTRGRLTSVFEWLALAAALSVMAKPTDVRRLIGLAVAQLVLLYWQAPLTADHAVLSAVGNIVIVFTFVWMRRSGPVSGPAVFARSRSALRLSLLIAYSAAALAKYNSGFFEVVGSCASELADIATFGIVDAEETGVQALHVAAAVVPETIIPLLLLIPITRRFGVRFGILFHFFVSLSPALSVRDFTAALFVFFPLFLSDVEVDDLVRRWRERRDAREPNRFHRAILDIPRVPRWIGFGIVAGAAGWPAEILHFFVVYAAFTVYGARLLILGFSTLRNAYPREPLINRISVAQVLVVLALLVHASSPYIGLRTSSTFTMFSNLRTEGPSTNHYFLPSVHVIDLQNDLVVVVDSNLDTLPGVDDLGIQFPRFEIGHLLSQEPDGYVIERTDAGDVRLGAGGESIDPPGHLARKLFHFRPTATSDDRTYCSN